MRGFTHSAQGHTHLGVLLMCLVAMSCCLDSVLCPVAQVVALYKATHLVGEPPCRWCACASLGASARLRCSGAYGLMAASWCGPQRLSHGLGCGLEPTPLNHVARSSQRQLAEVPWCAHWGCCIGWDGDVFAVFQSCPPLGPWQSALFKLHASMSPQYWLSQH